MKPAPRAIRLERIRRPPVPMYSRRAWVVYLTRLGCDHDEIAEVLNLEVGEVEQLLQDRRNHDEA